MSNRERRAARWWNLYRQLSQLDPGDFVGRWLVQDALNRLEGSFVSKTGESAGYYGPGSLPYPEWVKNLGLVAETGAYNMPKTLAPLGAQASLTPSQMPGLLGMLALASIKHPTAEKLPQAIRRRLPEYQLLMPDWGQYQQAIENLPSLWEEYQRLSQKLFPKTYSVRPRWATAYQR